MMRRERPRGGESPEGLYKINRKYREKFNMSLVSKYEEKEDLEHS